MAVPNNDLDTVASAWAKGRVPKKAPHKLKAMKTIARSWISGGDAVHYLWPISDDEASISNRRMIGELARSVVSLGWGVDLAVGDAEMIASDRIHQLGGERWEPITGRGGNALRVPVRGTLDALLERHQQFLGRLSKRAFVNPLPLSVFDRRIYRHSNHLPTRPFAAFSILRPDGSGFRMFNPMSRALTVVGMMRHAASEAAFSAGWSQTEVNSLILGHRHDDAETDGHAPVGPARFAYFPLPSIEWRGGGFRIGGIRRALVSSFSEDLGPQIDWARRALSGCELVAEATREVIGLLSAIPSSDPIVRRYVLDDGASEWATVLPAVLPGRTRLRSDARIERLLRKAILQAGFPKTLSEHAELDWGGGGFLAGAEMASRYGVPNHLRQYPRLHVRIGWRDAQGRPVRVRGPVCIGGGRFYGLGLCASLA